MTLTQTDEHDAQTAPSLAVIGIGMATSLGGAVGGAAAHRAGISRARQLTDHPAIDPFTHEQTYIVGHPARGVDDGFRGLARYLKLVHLAIEDLKDNHPDALSGRPGLCLILPVHSDKPGWGDPYPRFSANELAAAIQEHHLLTPIKCQIFCSDSHQTTDAMRAGEAMLAEGSVDRCAILAVDSFIEWRRLRAELHVERLKTARNPLGFIPGEAACILVLALAPPLNAPGNTTLGVLRIPQKMTQTTDVGIGGLKHGDYLRDTLSQLGPAANGRLLVNLTGEGWCAERWGMSQIGAPLGQWDTRFPLISFGHVGVVFSCLSIALTLRSFQRESRAGRTSLIVELFPGHTESVLVVEKV